MVAGAGQAARDQRAGCRPLDIPEPGQQVQAVLAIGQHAVEVDQVDGFARQQFARALGRVRVQMPPTEPIDGVGNLARQAAVVLDHEDRQCAGRAGRFRFHAFPATIFTKKLRCDGTKRSGTAAVSGQAQPWGLLTISMMEGFRPICRPDT
ncbi:hypothetical protein [Thauera sp. SDU_THAU2]|uniref:hypothetical protein n=1 Tax=Thauera sp. SDU_THAU2 TaxID=3136633 RepID=UPI00311F5C09